MKYLCQVDYYRILSRYINFNFVLFLYFKMIFKEYFPPTSPKLHKTTSIINECESETEGLLYNHKIFTYKELKTVYVKMQLKLQFGKALYLVGNCKQLGYWILYNSYRMEWTQDNYWRCSFSIPYDTKIQYKYVIGNYENPQQGPLKWESGQNRILYIEDLESKQIFLNQKWNHEKIKLQLVAQACQEQQIYVIGNCIELGLWTSKRFMNKQKVIQIEGQTKYIWTLNFYVQKQKDIINYNYIKVKNNQQYRQRESFRILNLKEINKNIQDTKNRITLMENPGQIRVIDSDGFLGFRISKINDCIYVGAFLKFEQEIKQLTKNNVKAVLNLQSKQDMKSHGLNWKLMKQSYQKNNIKAYNYQILDMKINDFINKSKRAVQLMRQIIIKHGNVYVHCTAGIYRSPQVVVLYLIKYYNYTIQQAIKLVKQKRMCANPHEKCIQLSVKWMEQEAEKQNYYEFQSQKLNLKI